MNNKSISTKVGDIHYLENGVGKTVILLPSMWLTSKSYEQIGSKLTKHFHVVIPDLHRGSSKQLKLAKSFEDYAETLHCFIKALKINNFQIVGFSFAGLIAAWYDKKFPSSAKKMVLVSTTLVPLKKPSWRFVYGYMKLLFNYTFSLTGIKINLLWLTDGFNYFLKHPRQFVTDFFIATTIYNTSITKLSITTKLLFADKDEFIPFKSVRRMKKIENLDIETIKGWHAWFFFNHQRLLYEIKAFE